MTYDGKRIRVQLWALRTHAIRLRASDALERTPGMGIRPAPSIFASRTAREGKGGCMKRAVAVLLVLGMASLTGCATICPPIAGEDKATHDVNCAIAIATEVDHLASIAAVIPALAEGYAVYHAALPLAIKAAQDALAAYEAGGSNDWVAAVTFLTSLYKDIEAFFTAHGSSSLVAQAKLAVAQPGYTCKNWKVKK